jgi:spermidine/putrescine transport system substrate-binding protein
MLRNLSALVAVSALTLGLGLGLTGCGSRTPVENKTVRVLIWSDYLPEEVVKDFEAQTGLTVKVTPYEETEAMIVTMDTGGGSKQYDVLIASDHAIPILTSKKLIAKLDKTTLSNVANIDPAHLGAPYDPQNTYSTPYLWGTGGILYNKKKFPELAQSWSVMFDGSKQVGNFALLENMRDTMGAVQKYQGHSVNTIKPEEITQASAALVAMKAAPKFKGFAGSPANCKAVIGGEIDLAMVYNGDAMNNLASAGDKAADFDYFVPQEGSIVWVDNMVVPAGAPNAAGAYKFINYILEAKAGAALAKGINYATPNKAAKAMLDKETLGDTRIYPSEDTFKKMEYLLDIGAGTKLYDSAWTTVKSQ